MTIELKLWQFVLIVLAAFEFGMFFMAWWAYRDNDIYTEFETEDTDNPTEKFMMEGKL
jgi:hypothetical protein